MLVSQNGAPIQTEKTKKSAAAEPFQKAFPAQPVAAQHVSGVVAPPATSSAGGVPVDPVPQVPVSLQLPLGVSLPGVSHGSTAADVEVAEPPTVSVPPAAPPVILQSSTGASIELVDDVLDTPPKEEDTEYGVVPMASSLLEGDHESSSNKESLIGSPRVKPKKKKKASKRSRREEPEDVDQDEFGSPVVRKKKRISGKNLEQLAASQSAFFPAGYTQFFTLACNYPREGYGQRCKENHRKQ